MGYVLKDVVMKVLLIRWYLIVGELAIEVYGGGREKGGEPDEVTVITSYSIHYTKLYE